MGVFRRGDSGGEKSHPEKKHKQRKPNNSRGIPENPLERELQFPQTRMLLGHQSTIGSIGSVGFIGFIGFVHPSRSIP
jgi:hypothetical protein